MYFSEDMIDALYHGIMFPADSYGDIYPADDSITASRTPSPPPSQHIEEQQSAKAEKTAVMQGMHTIY